MRPLTHAGAGMFIATLAALPATAQEALLPSSSWGTAPVFSAWHFSTPVKQPDGAISSVTQFALPLRARTVVGGKWNLDVSGAMSTSSVTLDNNGTSTSLTLTGLTDVRVRATGAIAGDRVLLTAGVNLPTGTTGLDRDQTTVLQTIGSPSLRMPVAGLGVGPGATIGLIAARESGPWSLAAGASLEGRAEYTPIELSLSSGTSLTKVSPGKSLHLTLGGDRPISQGRLSLLVVTDAYTGDQITTGAEGSTTTTKYKLGPQVTALSRMDLALPGWREAGTNVAFRYRSQFTDAAGTSIAGSSGSYLDASFNGIRGGSAGRALVLGVDARYQSGLSFTDALVGAGVEAVGVTVGVELPGTSRVVRLAARGQVGHFTTQTSSTNGMGLSLIAAIAARREAR